MTEDLCSSCKDVHKTYNSFKQPENLLTFCLPVKVLLLNRHQPEKDNKVREFVKKVSAVRNSGGGKVLIHLRGKCDLDRYLGNLDQFTDDLLPDLIEDGTVYADNFYRSFLCDQPEEEFRNLTEFVVLDVRSSSSISTAEFNTRVCSDQSVRRPTRFNILSLLRRSAKKASKRKADHRHPASKRVKLEERHESRSVQLKTFPKEKIKTILRSATELANYIWVNLRLREYICSMSMLDTGGIYYLGISEQEFTYGEGTEEYKSKIPSITGVRLDQNVKADLKAKLLERSRSDIRVFCGDGKGKIVTSQTLDILNINWLEDEQSVFEAVVKPVNGVVFFDCGPKSYHIVRDKIAELDSDTWFTKVLEGKYKI